MRLALCLFALLVPRSAQTLVNGAGAVVFGATDQPMNGEQLGKAKIKPPHSPTVLGAVVATYNLPGLNRELNVTAEALARERNPGGTPFRRQRDHFHPDRLPFQDEPRVEGASRVGDLGELAYGRARNAAGQVPPARAGFGDRGGRRSRQPARRSPPLHHQRAGQPILEALYRPVVGGALGPGFGARLGRADRRSNNRGPGTAALLINEPAPAPH